ncbi:OmpA family protein [Leptospira vanthielii]|uniref:OmpA family protein n=1 Tax=Leptospira vanthielii serovar Holland str. Waz Holland = ATCC 700522 TaxID=1218591 RepID=N1W3X0_9LEPT|nr:OmpA family protein [Leptospira vanthielii serovar Holland str. Waz Holland = ATCC 700522]
MQKMNWKCLFIYTATSIFFSASTLYGQGFDRGSLVFYGFGSSGLGNHSGSMEKTVETTNQPNFLMLNSPYVDTINRAGNYIMIAEFTKDRTELSSYGGELGFEYGIFRYFGIGLSYSNQVISASYFRALEARNIILLSFLGPNTNSQLEKLNLGDTYDLAVQSRRTVFSANSGDLNLFFHFLPNEIIDPYIRIGGGVGFEQMFGGITNRVFGAIGLRYHFDSQFFLSTEIEHSNVYIVKYEAPNSGHRNRGNYEETFFKLGLGVNFSLLGPTNPIPEPENKQTKVIESVGPEIPSQTKEPVVETKLERFVFLAREIFDLPSSRIHLEGRARLDAIARSLENEYKDFDVQVITYTTPFKEEVPGNYENYDIGFERSQAISRVLREKGVNPKRITDSTQGSTMYNVDSKEKVVIELRKNR